MGLNGQDESVIRRLAYVKGLYRMGVVHLRIETPLNTAQAVLTFDNALEMALRLAVDVFGYSTQKQ